MDIFDVKVGEYYMYEFQILDSEPIIMKVTDVVSATHVNCMVLSKSGFVFHKEIPVDRLRELTLEEQYSVLRGAFRRFWDKLQDCIESLWYKLVAITERTIISLITMRLRWGCKHSNNHQNVIWFETKYSDSDHYYYDEGKCRDCGQRVTKERL